MNKIIVDNEWKIRYIIALSLVTIKEETKIQSIAEESGKQLVNIRATEINENVKEVFNNQDLIKKINSALRVHWETEKDKIKVQLDEKLKKLKSL